MSSRRSEFWIPGDGIIREVIQSEICRHLGNDALVRPGNQNGVRGYIITAMRPLTTAQLQDIQRQSDSYGRENRDRGYGGSNPLPYIDSVTAATRQSGSAGYGGGYQPGYQYPDPRQGGAGAGSSAYAGYPPQSNSYQPQQPPAASYGGQPGSTYGQPPNPSAYGYRPTEGQSSSYPQADAYGQPYGGYPSGRPDQPSQVPRGYEQSNPQYNPRTSAPGGNGYENDQPQFDRTTGQWVTSSKQNKSGY